MDRPEPSWGLPTALCPTSALGAHTWMPLSSLLVLGERGAQAPGPVGGTLGWPFGAGRCRRLAPGVGVPAFYAPRSIQMRNSACGQVARHSLTKSCLLSGTLTALDNSPEGGPAFWSTCRLPSCFSQLSSLLPSPLPTPGLRPIQGHLPTHSLLISERCSWH